MSSMSVLAEITADDVIRRSVRGLASGRGISIEELAVGIGMPRTTLYRKLRGHGRAQAFTGGEIATLADYFGVPVMDLYEGLGGRFLPTPPPPSAGGLTVGALPRLDSNQEPAG